MLKAFLLLLVLFVVETYGVYGAAVTKKVTKACTLEIGPLCYAWEDNALGKLLGEKSSEEVEAALKKAKEAWDKDFIEKVVREKGAAGLNKALEGVKQGLEDGADSAKKAVEKAVEELKQ